MLQLGPLDSIKVNHHPRAGLLTPQWREIYWRGLSYTTDLVRQVRRMDEKIENRDIPYASTIVLQTKYISFQAFNSS